MPLTMNEPGIKSSFTSSTPTSITASVLTSSMRSFAILALPLMLTAMSGGATRETTTWPLRLMFSHVSYFQSQPNLMIFEQTKQIIPNGAECGPHQRPQTQPPTQALCTD